MTDDETVVLTVHGAAGPPTPAEAAAELGVAEEDIHAGTGVVPVDPGRGIYAVAVRADRVPANRSHLPERGPYSNPRIEGFGPVQEGDERRPD